MKGWKALGNRLSQHKVTKVKRVEEPEDSGLEEGDEENDLVESSPAKKKLTPEPKKSQKEGKKAKVVQQSLFEESEVVRRPPQAGKTASAMNGRKKPKSAVFTSGQTIELEL